jgi:hypothetical protein
MLILYTVMTYPIPFYSSTIHYSTEQHAVSGWWRWMVMSSNCKFNVCGAWLWAMTSRTRRHVYGLDVRVCICRMYILCMQKYQAYATLTIESNSSLHWQLAIGIAIEHWATLRAHQYARCPAQCPMPTIVQRKLKILGLCCVYIIHLLYSTDWHINHSRGRQPPFWHRLRDSDPKKLFLLLRVSYRLQTEGECECELSLCYISTPWL